MPEVVRLAADVPEGELRVYWDETDEGRCLHAWGPRHASRVILDMLAGKRLALRGDVSFAARLDMYGGVLEEGPSIEDTLRAMGYDPRTLVFSIRKQGVPAQPAAVPDDVRTRLEDASMALRTLAKALAAREEAKGVHVFDDGEMDDVMNALGEAQAAVAHAAELANGTAPPSGAIEA